MTLLAPIADAVGALPEQINEWDVAPAIVGGQHVGTAIVKGTEIHFALFKDWRPKASSRGAIRAFLAPLLERRGFLTTRVAHERAEQKQFVERVGFRPTWADGQAQYYLLGRLPFERKK